jgi:hypothetical protein
MHFNFSSINKQDEPPLQYHNNKMYLINLLINKNHKQAKSFICFFKCKYFETVGYLSKNHIKSLSLSQDHRSHSQLCQKLRLPLFYPAIQIGMMSWHLSYHEEKEKASPVMPGVRSRKVVRPENRESWTSWGLRPLRQQMERL